MLNLECNVVLDSQWRGRIAATLLQFVTGPEYKLPHLDRAKGLVTPCTQWALVKLETFSKGSVLTVPLSGIRIEPWSVLEAA